jgi:hypothetical protein
MSLKTWEARVSSYNEGTPIPNSLINALVNRLRIHMCMRKTPAQHDEICFLESTAIYQYGDGPAWRITDEQTQKGLAWLKRSSVRKYFGEDEARIIADFTEFSFEGVRLDWNGMRQDAAPVYRVHGANGEFFDYSATAWQQGSKNPFQILRTYSSVKHR